MKTKVIKIQPEFPDLDKIAEGSKIIRDGGLVIFPTETVYGIAADYNNEKAMQRLREVKQRSDGKPFSVMISQSELISNYTSSTNTAIYKLIEKYWPGPLTIVVPALEKGETVGLRVPDHEIARRLVAGVRSAVAAPSANLAGKNPPTTCDEALVDLDGLIDLAIDGGPATLGKGSTVVDISTIKPKVLREGLISIADIEKVCAKKTVLFVCTGNSCRSVMAEYVLKSKLKDRPDIEVVSAGTNVFIQSTASSETLSVLAERKIDARLHRSQPISTILLKKADIIFVMTNGHRQQVLSRVPEVEKRIYLLREFCEEPGNLLSDLDIPDPIGRDHDEYQYCLRTIDEAINRVVKLL